MKTNTINSYFNTILSSPAGREMISLYTSSSVQRVACSGIRISSTAVCGLLGSGAWPHHWPEVENLLIISKSEQVLSGILVPNKKMEMLQ